MVKLPKFRISLLQFCVCPLTMGPAWGHIPENLSLKCCRFHDFVHKFCYAKEGCASLLWSTGAPPLCTRGQTCQYVGLPAVQEINNLQSHFMIPNHNIILCDKTTLHCVALYRKTQYRTSANCVTHFRTIYRYEIFCVKYTTLTRLIISSYFTTTISVSVHRHN